MIETGRVCVKIAGSESGKYCVVVEQIDENFVLVDGEVKRGRCNIKHLELLPFKLDISKNDTTDKILAKMLEANIIQELPKKKEKKEAEKKEAKPKKEPKKQKATKAKSAKAKSTKGKK